MKTTQDDDAIASCNSYQNIWDMSNCFQFVSSYIYMRKSLMEPLKHNKIWVRWRVGSDLNSLIIHD